MPKPHRPTAAVRLALRKLGADLREARLRRNLPAQVVADRAFTSRPAVRRVEAGDHGVSVGIYASVLQALGLLEGFGQLADPSRDRVGLSRSAARLPKRARLHRAKEPSRGD